MNKITSASLFFLAAGILTSVTILSGYQVLFTVALFYFGFKAFQDKDLALPSSAYWLITFSIIALLTTLLNLELIPKPSKNFGRIKYFVYGYGGIYIFRYWIKDASNKTKNFIANTFLLSVVIAGIYAIVYYITTPSDSRARPLTETMRYGYGSGMFLLTLLSAYIHREKLKEWLTPRWVLTAFIIGFTGMFLTFTRGALVGFIAGLPFVLLFYKRKVALIATLASLILLGSFAGYSIYGNRSESGIRLLSSKTSGSDETRLSQWQAAIIAIKERPLLGWGLSNFHTQLKRIKVDNNLYAKEYNDAHAHNVFLEIGAGTGLIGLFLFLGWLIFWCIECFKAGGLVAALVVPFGASFVVSGQFEVTFDANNASMIFFVYALSSSISFDKLKST